MDHKATGDPELKLTAGQRDVNFVQSPSQTHSITPLSLPLPSFGNDFGKTFQEIMKTLDSQQKLRENVVRKLQQRIRKDAYEIHKIQNKTISHHSSSCFEDTEFNNEPTASSIGQPPCQTWKKDDDSDQSLRNEIEQVKLKMKQAICILPRCDVELGRRQLRGRHPALIKEGPRTKSNVNFEEDETIPTDFESFKSNFSDSEDPHTVIGNKIPLCRDGGSVDQNFTQSKRNVFQVLTKKPATRKSRLVKKLEHTIGKRGKNAALPTSSKSKSIKFLSCDANNFEVHHELSAVPVKKNHVFAKKNSVMCQEQLSSSETSCVGLRRTKRSFKARQISSVFRGQAWEDDDFDWADDIIVTRSKNEGKKPGCSRRCSPRKFKSVLTHNAYRGKKVIKESFDKSNTFRKRIRQRRKAYIQAVDQSSKDSKVLSSDTVDFQNTESHQLFNSINPQVGDQNKISTGRSSQSNFQILRHKKEKLLPKNHLVERVEESIPHSASVMDKDKVITTVLTRGVIDRITNRRLSESSDSIKEAYLNALDNENYFSQSSMAKFRKLTYSQAHSHRKWIYSKEEKGGLYSNKAFVAVFDESQLQSEKLILWRIHEDLRCIQKFLPFKIQGRVFHHGTTQFRRHDLKSEWFYAYYQPVFTVIITDEEDMQIVQHFSVDHLQPFLWSIRKTSYLQYDFTVVLQILATQMICPDFIPKYVSKRSSTRIPYFANSWDIIQNIINEALSKISRINLPTELTDSIRKYSKAVLSKLAGFKNEKCGICQKNHSLYFSLGFSGSCYDPETFQDLETSRTDTNYYTCFNCGRQIKFLHKLTHGIKHMHSLLTSLITEYALQLAENEIMLLEEIVAYFVSDYEWVTRMFLDFQVTLEDTENVTSNLKIYSPSKKNDKSVNKISMRNEDVL